MPLVDIDLAMSSTRRKLFDVRSLNFRRHPTARGLFSETSADALWHDPASQAQRAPCLALVMAIAIGIGQSVRHATASHARDVTAVRETKGSGRAYAATRYRRGTAKAARYS